MTYISLRRDPQGGRGADERSAGVGFFFLSETIISVFEPGVFWPASVQPHVLRAPDYLGPRKNVVLQCCLCFLSPRGPARAAPVQVLLGFRWLQRAR